MDISLRQLRYALAVADTGHFGRAAERSHVTQPALSQQIRQLEELCGTGLFDRTGKTVRLTPFGREFVHRARAVLDQADMLGNFVASRSGAPSRPIRFGLIPTVAPYLLPQIFPALQTTLPEVDFAISESRTEPLLQGLDEGTLDLALIASEPRSIARLTVAPLFDDAFVLATNRQMPDDGPVPLGEVDGDRMLLLDEGHCFRDQAIAACALDPDVTRRTFAATSLSTIVEFVANGQGVTLLPEIALAKEASDRIVIHRLKSPGAKRQLSLVWREATPFAELFEQIAETIRAVRH